MTFYFPFLKMCKSIVGCWLIPFLDNSIPCVVLWKSKYGNRYYCFNRNTFSTLGKVVPHEEKEKIKYGKKVLFPNRGILWKPNENHKKKHMNFMWKTWNFFPVFPKTIFSKYYILPSWAASNICGRSSSVSSTMMF